MGCGLFTKIIAQPKKKATQIKNKKKERQTPSKSVIIFAKWVKLNKCWQWLNFYFLIFFVTFMVVCLWCVL